MEAKNILIVDDDLAVCRVFAAMLGQLGYDVVTLTDGREAMKFLKAGDFDVVLVDLVMPELDGLALIDQIREHYLNLPILVVTGYGGAETTVAAMRRGATDFVTKPVDGAFLDLRIRRAWDLEHARRLANTDGLTGLYNHRYLQDRLAQEIDRAERYKRPLSVIMADLDHFKLFNDAHGHPEGDVALIKVAQTLRRLVRAADIVARYGGEEFTFILPETSLEDAQVLAERARQCVEALDLTANGEKVTLSLGVAPHVVGSSKEVLIRSADAALYQAKHRGRNQVCTLDANAGLLDRPKAHGGAVKALPAAALR